MNKAKKLLLLTGTATLGFAPAMAVACGTTNNNPGATEEAKVVKIDNNTTQTFDFTPNKGVATPGQGNPAPLNPVPGQGTNPANPGSSEGSVETPLMRVKRLLNEAKVSAKATLATLGNFSQTVKLLITALIDQAATKEDVETLQTAVQTLNAQVSATIGVINTANDLKNSATYSKGEQQKRTAFEKALADTLVLLTKDGAMLANLDASNSVPATVGLIQDLTTKLQNTTQTLEDNIDEVNGLENTQAAVKITVDSLVNLDPEIINKLSEKVKTFTIIKDVRDFEAQAKALNAQVQEAIDTLIKGYLQLAGKEFATFSQEKQKQLNDAVEALNAKFSPNNKLNALEGDMNLVDTTNKLKELTDALKAELANVLIVENIN